MKDKAVLFLVIVSAIVVTGFVLDELGNKGRLGELGRKFAQKVTKGYGV